MCEQTSWFVVGLCGAHDDVGVLVFFGQCMASIVDMSCVGW